MLEQEDLNNVQNKIPQKEDWQIQLHTHENPLYQTTPP